MALLTSVLTGGINNHPTTSEEANFVGTDFFTAGIVGAFTATNSVAPMTGGFAVNAQGTPDMTVAVTAGAAYVTATPSGQNSQRLRVRLTANQNVTIAANSSGSTKYDWVYIKIDPTLASAPTLAGDTVATLVTSRSTSNSTDNGTPPTYGLAIAVVTVANGAVSITNSTIRDIRSAASLNTVTANDGWTTGGLPAVSSVTNNGNRSYDITFASSVASTLSSGMRLRTTRTAAAPTQCTSLNGTTQYYSKTSPNKLTFTDDFVVSAWIKLSSYPTSAGPIASRIDATQGWWFGVNSSGQLILSGHNAALANYRRVVSYQSVPLNKWVHVTAQLDMSTYTATTTTCYTMFDGKDVPASLLQNGTNPTTLVQAGTLMIGSYGAAADFFPGKIAQVAIYNAKVTQATILASMNQGLSGSETSLASAYSFNNAITDLNTTTPNDLTANGSAVATNADSPFGNAGTSSTLDYALVQAVSTTVATVQVPEGCTIPTSGGVTSVAYSVQGNPYGWVSDKGRWEVGTYLIAISALSTTNTTWSSGTVNGSYALTIPTGSWNTSYLVSRYSDQATGAVHTLKTTLSTSNSSESNALFTAFAKGGIGSATVFLGAEHTMSLCLSLTSATPYYLLGLVTTNTGAAATHNINGDGGISRVIAVPSNL